MDVQKEKKTKNPSVSIIIVTWNSSSDIKANLSSVLNSNYTNIDSILVVDNFSKDSTVDLVRANFPEVEIIESKKNTYFTGGNNIGYKFLVKKYNSKYIITLNPDTVVKPNWIDELVEIAEKDSKIGIVSPKIVFWNNVNEGLINSAGLIYDGYMQAYDKGFKEKDIGQYDKTEELDAVSGTCMLIRTDMIRDLKYLFWSKLRMYLEDLELCIRAKKNGWKVVYTPNTTVAHSYMQSTNQSSIVRKKDWIDRNWLLIALKHYKFKSKIAVIRDYIKGRFINLKT